ncbi:hypothetical protein GCM10023079_14530 [Streptomyces chitinivorans]
MLWPALCGTALLTVPVARLVAAGGERGAAPGATGVRGGGGVTATGVREVAARTARGSYEPAGRARPDP